MRKKKGLVTHIHGNKAIVMTKNGEFLKVNLPEKADIGSEIEFFTKPNFLPLVAGIIIFFFIGWTMISSINPVAAAYMTLDVSSGLELSLDKNLNVISVKSTGEAGEEFVSKLNVKGMQVKDAVNSIMDEAVNQNLLEYGQKEKSEIILATVTSNNPKVSLNEEEVGKWVSANLHKHELINDVVVQSGSTEDWENAKKQKISPAKYIIIKKIEEEGIDVDEIQEELLNSNVKDLVMIMNEKKRKSDNKTTKDQELVMEETNGDSYEENPNDELDVDNAENRNPSKKDSVPTNQPNIGSDNNNSNNNPWHGPNKSRDGKNSESSNKPDYNSVQDEMGNREEIDMLNNKKKFDNNNDIVKALFLSKRSQGLAKKAILQE